MTANHNSWQCTSATINAQQQPQDLEFEPSHQLITFTSFQTMQTLSLDSRAPVERWSGHYQRLEEKLEEGRVKEEKSGHEILKSEYKIPNPSDL